MSLPLAPTPSHPRLCPANALLLNQPTKNQAFPSNLGRMPPGAPAGGGNWAIRVRMAGCDAPPPANATLCLGTAWQWSVNRLRPSCRRVQPLRDQAVHCPRILEGRSRSTDKLVGVTSTRDEARAKIPSQVHIRAAPERGTENACQHSHRAGWWSWHRLNLQGRLST